MGSINLWFGKWVIIEIAINYEYIMASVIPALILRKMKGGDNQ